MKNIFLGLGAGILLISSCQLTSPQSTDSSDSLFTSEEEIQLRDTTLENFDQELVNLMESFTSEEPSKDDNQKKFELRLQEILREHENSINYAFPKLVEAGMVIADSEDGKLRSYSWDDMRGGSMRYYNNLFQFMDQDKVVLKLESTEDDKVYYPIYEKIESFSVDQKVYYILFALNIFSNKLVNSSIEIYSLQQGALTPAKMIETPEGMDYILGETYDFQSLNDSDSHLITFDKNQLQITFPVIDENEQVSKKVKHYKLVGQKFKLQK